MDVVVEKSGDCRLNSTAEDAGINAGALRRPARGSTASVANAASAAFIAAWCRRSCN